MSMSSQARPTPGTTELLEVLDRALTGGIVIALDRRINVVGLARSGHRARIVVAATETYLRHPEPERDGRPAAAVLDTRPRHEPARRLG